MNGYFCKKQKQEQSCVKARVSLPAIKPWWPEEKELFSIIPIFLLFYSNILKIYVRIGF